MPTNWNYIGNPEELLSLGGLTTRLTATALLKYGDAVFASASREVNKSVVAGDRLKRVGIVVGDSESVLRASQLVGTTAAAAAGKVYVCYSGVAFGVVGATPLTAGMQLMFSAATAGVLIPATPTTDAGKIVGMALEDQATAGAAIKVLVALS